MSPETKHQAPALPKFHNPNNMDPELRSKAISEYMLIAKDCAKLHSAISSYISSMISLASHEIAKEGGDQKKALIDMAKYQAHITEIPEECKWND